MPADPTPRVAEVTDAVRVAVTRPAAQAGALVVALSDRGLTPVRVPLLRARIDPDAVAAGLDRRPEWVAVTSANGARALVAALDGRSDRPPRLAAVGERTAAVLAAAGRAVEVVPSVADAEHLVALLTQRRAADILLPLGDRARPTLADGLRDAGWEVERVVAYRVAPTPPAEVDATALRSCALVTLTSPSIAEALVAAVPATDCPPVAVIGPTTAERARELGLDVVATADPRDAAGLAAAAAWALGLAPAKLDGNDRHPTSDDTTSGGPPA